MKQTRRTYLTNLAGEYGLPPEIVYSLASLLGPSEDYDGLIVELQDYTDETEYETYQHISTE